MHMKCLEVIDCCVHLNSTDSHARNRRRPWLKALIATCILLLVGACGGGGSSSPTEPGNGPVDLALAEVIEAIFLGSGPVGRGGCPFEGRWSAYRPGTAVRVVIGAEVTQAARDELVRELALINEAVAGHVTLISVDSVDRDPQPSSFEITTADLSDGEIDAICGFGNDGCTTIVFSDGPILNASRSVQRKRFPGTAHVHEIGHGLGLCHIAASAYPDAMMADPQRSSTRSFSDIERRAIETVYRSGLSPGSNRDAFVRAGLIRP